MKTSPKHEAPSTLTFRFDSLTHAGLVQQAKSEGVSLNSFLIYQLTDILHQEWENPIFDRFNRFVVENGADESNAKKLEDCTARIKCPLCKETRMSARLTKTGAISCRCAGRSGRCDRTTSRVIMQNRWRWYA